MSTVLKFLPPLRSIAIRSLIDRTGWAVAVAITLLSPIIYVMLSASHLSDDLHFKAKLNSSRIAQLIYVNEAVAEYQGLRITELIDLGNELHAGLHQRVFGPSGRLIAQRGIPQTGLSTTVAEPILLRGQPWGRIELETTLRPYIWAWLGVAICSLIIGLVTLIFLRTLPLSVLDEAMGELERKNNELVAFNADLERRVVERTADATAAADRALAASSAKSNFLAVMSHEIRTPMNAVLGLTSSLLEAKLDKEHHQTVRAIYDSGENLLGILNDILDYSKLEAGRMEFEKALFYPRETIDNTLSILAPRAEAKGIKLNFIVDEKLPEVLIGDGGRIRQVLLNLVSNAIKFTETGGVTIRADLKGQRGNMADVEWSVIDTGIGIAPENVNKLFGDYTQADSTINRKFGGTGLGLSICKRIVEQMGGDILLSSKIGRGTTVRFSVALEIGEHQAKIDVTADMSGDALSDYIGSLGRRMVVLVVDDNATNRLVVSKMLQSFDIKIDMACDGSEAVTAAGQQAYDAILMDVRMPEMDGYEATRRIRQQSRLNSKTPIIGLTANAFAEDVAACKAAGMDGFAAKPIRKKVLVEEIAKFLKAEAVDAGRLSSKHSSSRAA